VAALSLYKRENEILGPPERARAETGGADQWVLKRRKFPGFAVVNEKKRPHPWDTHYQFSIKTSLSKGDGKKYTQKKPNTIYIISLVL